MKYNVSINQKYAIQFGIDNVNQAGILDLLISASSWAETIIIENEVFYWVSRQKISEELAFFNLKDDTIYRHLKKLNEKGLLVYKKVNKKDCIKLTEKGKRYSFVKLGNKSDFEQNSEINPTKLGNKSELNSEINPTYNNTNINNNTKDNKKPPKINFWDELQKEVETILREKKLFTFKEKFNLAKTKKEIKSFEGAALQISDVRKIAKEYVNYIDRNRRKSARFNKWMIAYIENNLSDIEYSKPLDNKPPEIKPKFDKRGRAIFTRDEQ